VSIWKGRAGLILLIANYRRMKNGFGSTSRLATREKKPESEREAFTADRVQVLAERWLLAGPSAKLKH